MDNKPKVILVIAAPGAGKSTQCKLLASNLNLVHLSIGQILRQQRIKDTDQGKQLNKYMKQFQSTGQLMPCQFIQKYLVRKMKSLGWQKNTYLIDGYIKSKYMYEFWDQTIGDNTNLLGVLYYECGKETLMGRLVKRAEGSEREDDKNKVLTEVRISSFYKNTLPVVEIFREKGVLVTVDAEKSIEEVYQKSEEVVKIMLSN